MITWIVSYPKSGNTWVRSFLCSYLSNKDDFNFEELAKINKFPRNYLLNQLNVNKYNLKDVASNWIPMQAYINLKNKITYLKTHNAMMTINNWKFTDSDNTNGFIYLIRDPRDVLISYASYMNKSIDETFKIMIGNFSHSEEDGAITSSWSKHYNSWKNSKFDKIIIRYEDLIEDTENCFKKIINFLNKINNLPIDNEKIKRSIINTNFNKLKKLEESQGFSEAKQNKFFRKGKIGEWKKNLNPKIVERIEEEFNLEMKELDYL